MVLDSRGFPTVQVAVEAGGRWHTAQAPSGASTGSGEALERRDGGPRWHGKGVAQALADLEAEVLPALVGKDPRRQAEVDGWLADLDGTPQKSRLGANAILPVSLAMARAGAALEGVGLWRWLAEMGGFTPAFPTPTLNVLNGGAHADNGLDVQEFMFVPSLRAGFGEALRAGVECYHCLKRILAERGLSTALGDEGGFAPRLDSNAAGLGLLEEAIEQCGRRPGEEVALALDVAASELVADGGYRWEGGTLGAADLVGLYEEWAAGGLVVSLEDGMGESDDAGWELLTSRLGGGLHIVGDDLLCTDPVRVARARDRGLCNALLVKCNQIGTLTETLAAVAVAREAGWAWSVSHRSGETGDDFIADLAVGTGAAYIKAGAPARGERTAKYNRLLAIAATDGAGLPGA